MADHDRAETGTIGPEAGLRERKKAQRREAIIDAATALFSAQGYDATSVTDIANAIGISPPTVVNYFGSKENILSALIFEGTAQERSRHLKKPRTTDRPFADVLADLLADCTRNTMRIAGRRVWRYAEATNIRRPRSEFQRKFAESDNALRKLLARVLGDYAIVLRNGEAPDVDFLAQIAFDRWTMRYFAYIRDESITMQSHADDLHADAKSLVALMFDPEFARTSPLKAARR